MMQSDEQVRINDTTKDGILHPVEITTQTKNTDEFPLKVDTKTTDSSNLFVASMTVQTEKENTVPVFKSPAPVTVDIKDACKLPDALNTTITAIPEPQRASTPNITDEHLQNMNETIVAGFNQYANFTEKLTFTPEKVKNHQKY